MKGYLLPLLGIVAFLAATPGADAQVHQCGDIELIFLNPDLQPGGDGFIHASGAFFAQFQAIGAGAEEIETFGFSFGKHSTDIPEEVCQLPPQAWFTGQQIINYRADTDPSDGFFINLQTPLVPDGEYTAAVHAYNGDDEELARFWAKAIVKNCDDGEPAPCGDDTAQLQAHDTTQPWPIILPGDGQKRSDTTGFSLEFAEELSNLTVLLNGQDITGSLEDWEGRLWDDDVIPGYGPYGAGNILVPECSQPDVQTCSNLGVAYKWNERTLTDDDVLRVEAIDMSGNLAIKNIHIGSSVTSGAVAEEIPILSWTPDTTEAIVAPEEIATFTFTVQNKGGAQGHPFAQAEGPAGWHIAWNPKHVPVDPGESATQQLLVTAPLGTAQGTYPINASMTYTQAGTEKILRDTVHVTVDSNAAAPTEPDVEEDTEEDSPGFPVMFALAAVAVVAALRTRRG